MALKFGGEIRTPVMQAEPTTRRLTLREIFPPAMRFWLSEKLKFGRSKVLIGVDETLMPLVIRQQQLMTEAPKVSAISGDSEYLAFACSIQPTIETTI